MRNRAKYNKIEIIFHINHRVVSGDVGLYEIKIGGNLLIYKMVVCVYGPYTKRGTISTIFRTHVWEQKIMG